MQGLGKDIFQHAVQSLKTDMDKDAFEAKRKTRASWLKQVDEREAAHQQLWRMHKARRAGVARALKLS